MSESELKLLEAAQVRLFRAGGVTRLVVADSVCYLRITVSRAFPISDPHHYIGFHDGAGKDIGVLVEPLELDSESARILSDELEMRYFVPEVRQVLSVKEEFGAVYWRVATDRGEKEFVVRNLKDSVHELPGSRAMITDVEGARFLVPDIRKLDAKTTNILLRGL